MIYGTYLYNSRPHEYDIRIFNAGFMHLDYFNHIPNVEFSIREHFIGVRILDEAAIPNVTAFDETALMVLEELFLIDDITMIDEETLGLIWDADFISYQLLRNAIGKIGDINIFTRSGNQGITEAPYFVRIIVAFNAILFVLSLCVLFNARSSTIKLYLPDIGMMVAFGAEKKHLRRIFIVEFIIAFIVSASIAFGLSLVFMYVVITHFVQTTVMGTLWIVFNVNLFNSVTHILVFFIVGLISLFMTISTILKPPSVYLISSKNEGLEKARSKKRISMKNPITVLASILSKRTRIVRSSLVIVIPMTVMIIAIFNFMANAIFMEFPDVQTHLHIQKITGHETIENPYVLDVRDVVWLHINTPGFSEEDMDFVRNIPSVMEIEVIEGSFRDHMLITLNDVSESSNVYNFLHYYFNDYILYSIFDMVGIAEANRGLQMGFYVLTMLVFAVFFVVILIAINIKITGYVEMQSKNIYLLRIIGANNTDIMQSFMRRAFDVATIGVIISFALGFGIFRIFSYMAYTSFGDETFIVINSQTLYIQISIVVLFYIAFMLPMYISIKKKLIAKLCEVRRQIL